ncbi:MAG: hypothetical protein MI810_21290 [Flavobacteriales bacterium]|nr:hypothetical protein [Flavobacteriales bacterium]
MEYDVIKFGVVGFSKNAFDKKNAYQILDKIFTGIATKYPNTIIEIVSGYTNSGVPKIAYELADKYGFVTVGFSAEQALEVSSGVYPVSKVILKGERFGDESEDFIRYIDHLIRVGGGPQSLMETEMFKQKQEQQEAESSLIEHEVEWLG